MDALFNTIIYYGFAAVLITFFAAVVWFGWLALSSLFK